VTAAPVRLGGIVITNPTRKFWPTDCLTKLDVAQFYSHIASQILPWMRGRLVAAPPDVASEIPGYILGGTRKTLLTLVNLGSIAMPVMNGRVDQLDQPDWIAFDLDPCDAFASAARAALLLRAKLEDHGLEGFVKTSGGRGLHVLVPLRRGAGQERVRAYASAIAAEMAGEHPRLVTVEARKAKRRAPVYLDVKRNAPDETIVPPFSVRWRPRAPVSMPLAWDEVSPRLDPMVFNIKTAERRMLVKSPWSSFFGRRQTLPRV
jgi:bifunctional non-homologous end joining protein LigD